MGKQRRMWWQEGMVQGWSRAQLFGVAAAAGLALQGTPAFAAYYGDYGYGNYGGYGGYWVPAPETYPDVVHPRAHRPKAPARYEKAPTPPIAAAGHGVLQIVISLREQKLRLYADGTEVAHSQISTGVPEHPTPMGLFNVIQKQRWHTSNIYSDAPMPFMQRITWSGVALHLGVVPGHPASHGCIRMPDGFARELYGTTKIGARVIIARDEVKPVSFENPHLFALPHSSAPPSAVAPAGQPAAQNSGVSAPHGADEQKTPAEPIKVAAAAATESPDAAGSAVHAPGDDQSKPTGADLKPGPVSVFISRKEGKLFVRKGFESVFSVPVTIARPDEPLGTHLFTALALNPDGQTFRWDLVTLPGAPLEHRVASAKGLARERAAESATRSTQADSAAAAAALERISIPPDAMQQISALMSPGASLIISDYGLGLETGQGTDFVIVTR